MLQRTRASLVEGQCYRCRSCDAPVLGRTVEMAIQEPLPTAVPGLVPLRRGILSQRTKCQNQQEDVDPVVQCSQLEQ